MGYLEDAFTEFVFDAPILGGVADYLYRDAPPQAMIPGHGLVSGTTLNKIQSTSNAAFYTSVSLIAAAYSDGPFAYFTVKKLSTMLRFARFTPVALGATALVYASGSPMAKHLFDYSPLPRSR